MYIFIELRIKEIFLLILIWVLKFVIFILNDVYIFFLEVLFLINVNVL